MGGRRGQDLARLQTLVQIRIQIRTLTLRLVQTVIRGRLLLDLLVVGEDGSDGVAEVVRLRLHREQEPIDFNVFPITNGNQDNRKQTIATLLYIKDRR